jgi:outer membrane lipoprotein
MLLLLVASAAFACVGCASLPIPGEVRKQATPGLTFEQAFKQPEAHKGKKVLWGGQILDIQNEQDRTILHILQVPVDKYGEPGSADDSQGRFLAIFEKYLDGQVYKPGRKVTILGTIDGQREETLGQGGMKYRHPLIKGEFIHLWKKTYRRPAYSDPYYDPYYGGYYGPNWGTHFSVGTTISP